MSGLPSKIQLPDGPGPRVLGRIPGAIEEATRKILDGMSVEDASKETIEQETLRGIKDAVMQGIEKELDNDVTRKLAEKAVDKAIDGAWDRVRARIEALRYVQRTGAVPTPPGVHVAGYPEPTGSPAHSHARGGRQQPRAGGTPSGPDKSFLNLAKIYRSFGNSIGAALITAGGGYFGGAFLILLFVPHYYDDVYLSTVALWVILTLIICSTGLAFSCMQIIRLYKTGKAYRVEPLVKHARFLLASTCIGSTMVAWCGTWYLLGMINGFVHPDIILWPWMPSQVEQTIKILLYSIPAIAYAIVFLPVTWTQLEKIKGVFPPARSRWIPSYGHEGVKWAKIGGKLGLIAAFCAVYYPVFITWYNLTPYSYWDPAWRVLYNNMVYLLIFSLIATGGHAFAAVVAGAKSYFRFARGFIDIFREQAGLPPLPEGYRIPPGLLTRPAFFSAQEGDLVPHAFGGGRHPMHDVRGQPGSESPWSHAQGQFTWAGQDSDYAADPAASRSWYVAPDQAGPTSYMRPAPGAKAPHQPTWFDQQPAPSQGEVPSRASPVRLGPSPAGTERRGPVVEPHAAPAAAAGPAPAGPEVAPVGDKSDPVPPSTVNGPVPAAKDTEAADDDDDLSLDFADLK